MRRPTRKLEPDEPPSRATAPMHPSTKIFQAFVESFQQHTLF